MSKIKIGNWVRISGKPTRALRMKAIMIGEQESCDSSQSDCDGLENDEYCWANIGGESEPKQWGGSSDKHIIIDSTDVLEPFIGTLPEIKE